MPFTRNGMKPSFLLTSKREGRSHTIRARFYYILFIRNAGFVESHVQQQLHDDSCSEARWVHSLFFFSLMMVAAILSISVVPFLVRAFPWV